MIAMRIFPNQPEASSVDVWTGELGWHHRSEWNVGGVVPSERRRVRLEWYASELAFGSLVTLTRGWSKVGAQTLAGAECEAHST